MAEVDLKELHCLIVDDGPLFLQIFEGMLLALGMAVDPARYAEIAFPAAL